MPTFPDPNSIVDYLKSNNQQSDYAYRADLYDKLGLEGGKTGYLAAGKNNATQNIALLNALRSGKTVPTTPPAGSSTGGTTPPAGTGTTTPDAAATAAAAALKERYARTASPYDSKIKAAEDALGLTVGDAPSKEKILEEKRKNAEALVNSVTAEFNRVLDSEMTAGAGRNDRVRALNSSFGLQGSDFAGAAVEDQKTKNNKVLDMINQEKAAKIAAIYADVDSRASEEYRQQRMEYIKGLEGNLDRLREAKNEDRNKALNSIKSFAATGVKISDLKANDPATYKQLMEEYGGSELDIDAAWNAALPDNMKIKYTEKLIKNKDGKAVLMRYGVDPMNPGKVTENTYVLNVPYENLATGEFDETKDGRIIMKYPDGTIKYLTEMDAKTKSEINENNASAAASYASAAKSRADVASGGGANGYKFTNTDYGKLQNSGLKPAEIKQIQLDLNTHGIDAVKSGGLNANQLKVIQDILSTDGTFVPLFTK